MGAFKQGAVKDIDYTFIPSTGKIVFSSNYVGLELSEIFLITNVLSGTNIDIYDPNDATKGGSLSGLTLTLAYNTSGMGSSDPLRIICGVSNQPTLVTTTPTQDPVIMDQTDILAGIQANLDQLILSQDIAESMPINVNVQGGLKTDSLGAIIISDAATAIVAGVPNSNTAVILQVDTTGYQSLVAQVFNSTAFSLVAQTSQDGSTWANTTVITLNASFNLAVASSTTPVSGTILVCQAAGKYLRLLTQSTPSAGSKVIAYLRNFFVSSLSSVQRIDITSISAGTASVLPIYGLATGSTSTTGGLVVGSSFASGGGSVEYPITIGGAEAASLGFLSGKKRTIRTDTDGKLIITGNSQILNPQNVPGVTVLDQTQLEGRSTIEFMASIDTSLKIIAQYLADLPMALQSDNITFDDPDTLRSDYMNQSNFIN